MKYLGIDQISGSSGFVPAAALTPAGEIVEATAAIWRVTVSGVVATTKGAAVAMLITFSAFEGTDPSFSAARSEVWASAAPPSLSTAAIARAKVFNALTNAVPEDDSPDPDYGF